MSVIGLTPPQEGFDLRLLRRTVIQPSQARVIPIGILQSRPFRGIAIDFTIRATSPPGDKELLVSIPVTHLPHWSSDTSAAFHIKSTYLYSGFTPTAFLVKPPLESRGIPQAPVVALRRVASPLPRTWPDDVLFPLDGAGVDIIDLPFWRDALPRQGRSWTIIPLGRTSWVRAKLRIPFICLPYGRVWTGTVRAPLRCGIAWKRWRSY